MGILRNRMEPYIVPSAFFAFLGRSAFVFVLGPDRNPISLFAAFVRFRDLLDFFQGNLLRSFV